jgi:NADH:ubiquinone oxidoreductase subunit H
MEPPRHVPDQDRSRYSFGAILSIVTGMVVIVVGLSVVVALFGGLWLDSVLDTKPIMTIVFVVASGPLSLFLVYRLTRAATSRMRFDQPANQARRFNQINELGDDE